jgi:hypothetical protein
MSDFAAISGSRTLHRVLYASRVRIPAEDLDHEVHDIVRASIRNNRQVAVTGLLLVHDGWFVQALEGPADAVMNIYRRICDDPRHEDCKMLSAGPAATREFGDWNMCARRMSAADDAILTTLAVRGSFEPLQLTPTAALKLLKAVRGIQERTAHEGRGAAVEDLQSKRA